ncbi:hypothetical protein [Candidatus Halobonum tyrrellensis]|uniref:Glycoside hydrolase domain protein n=1 Tax=Candidatus Halobonum tyrrellensis G22 TaxID=1324957 RepID=V4IZK5_9EURY|nr:hypothetical protein [Candidatus Halobonum tyrrellensis]ESP88572.1 hypothetical protein K933_08932 [Candidatus Halobonum tyrrellensis G22]
MTDYGVVTRNAEEVAWSAFDRGFYEVKDVTGRSAEPLADATSMVSCFADNAAAESNPDLVPVDAAGDPATRDREYFDWAHVCPTNPDYRAGLLEIVEDCAAVAPDVRLDDVGFPREGFCHCDRCDRLFAESEYDDRGAWRASVITGFVADAADRVPGDLSLAVHPDPYPGHLFDRSGVDIEALAAHVDRFVAPLYDTAYGTTHWLETIAKGFESRLSGVDAALSVELYAVDVDVDALVGAIEVASAYADEVTLGYDASQAAAALRRMRADEREGVTHGDASGAE